MEKKELLQKLGVKEKSPKTRNEILRIVFIVVAILFLLCITCFGGIVNLFDSSANDPEDKYTISDLIDKYKEENSNDPRR